MRNAEKGLPATNQAVGTSIGGGRQPDDRPTAGRPISPGAPFARREIKRLVPQTLAAFFSSAPPVRDFCVLPNGKLPYWENFSCSHSGSMLAYADAGYSKVKTKEILGKQSEVQRCEETDDGMVQLLRGGRMELASRAKGRPAQCERSEE
jgi:hypothetical protein